MNKGEHVTDVKMCLLLAAITFSFFPAKPAINRKSVVFSEFKTMGIKCLD